MKKILAVASSGGHFVQLKILIDMLSLEGVEFIKTVSTTVGKSAVVFKTDYCVDDVSRTDFVKVFMVAAQAIKIILKEKPSLILSTGALPGLVFVAIGRVFGVKTIWVDSVANPERLSFSGRFAMRISNITLTQWQHLANDKVQYKGGVL